MKFRISIVFILIASCVLRFYSYDNRWGLAYDQAHDALVARFALESFQLPLVGPFSSAGPFQTGGEWYWFLMAATAFNQSSVITPWIVMTLLYIFFVFIAIEIGKILGGEKFAILVGVLSTVSTAQIAQSVNLTNQSPLSITSILAIWSMVNYIKTKKERYLFLLGLFVSLGFTIHAQGAAVFFLVLSTLFVSVVKKILTKKAMSLLFLGLGIPLLPLLVFDLQNDFVNSKSMLQYYLVDQYKISLDVLGRRWLTYLTVFWPNAWAHVLGGQPIISSMAMIALVIVTVVNSYKRNISKEWIILLGSFIGMIVLLRYVRTPLFDSFIVFSHPFIIFLTAFMIFSIFKRNVVIGLGLFLFIMFGTITKDFREIKGGPNITASKAERWTENLSLQFPGEKFAIYDYQYKSVQNSLPLVLFLQTDRKIDDGGRKIGVKGEDLINLDASQSASLSSEWSFVNPSEIYRTTEEWYND